jgi:hypothetical protein
VLFVVRCQNSCFENKEERLPEAGDFALCLRRGSRSHGVRVKYL